MTMTDSEIKDKCIELAADLSDRMHDPGLDNDGWRNRFMDVRNALDELAVSLRVHMNSRDVGPELFRPQGSPAENVADIGKPTWAEPCEPKEL